MLSERVSDHRTGRPIFFAAAATTANSGYIRSLAPNPPPTSGAITRTRFLSTPRSSARSLRISNGTCDDTQTVYPPSSSGMTAIAFVSMGTGARRCWTTRSRTTTSAPSRTSSSQ